MATPLWIKKLERAKILCKVLLTLSKYQSNDNLPFKLSIVSIYPLNYQLRQFTPQTTKTMIMYPNIRKIMKLLL
jgi:hypothetical protein